MQDVIRPSLFPALLALAALPGLPRDLTAQASYQPGSLASSRGLQAPLDPPTQEGVPEGTWRVAEGIDLHHFEQGEGEPVLVLHGGPGYPFAQPLEALEPLTDEFRFHYYDQRGCGRSSRPLDRMPPGNPMQGFALAGKTFGLAEQLADIERIRRVLGTEQLIVMGHSFGALLAALYAAEFPEHVRALILVAPADLLILPSPDGDLFTAIATRLPADLQAEYATFRRRYFDFGGHMSKSEEELAGLHHELTRFFAAAYPEDGDAETVEPDQVGGWTVFGLYLSMGMSHDYTTSLAKATAPTLILHGARDLQGEAAGRRYAEHLPAARFEVLEEAGHFPHRECPDELAQVLEDFLAELP